jgi:hypothetical protein
MPKPNKPARTPAQKAALRDAYKLLTAQFDDVLVVCSLRADLDGDATDLDVFWKGNWLVANGLADFAKHTINYRRLNKSEP